MPSFRASAGECARRSRPRTMMRPLSGRTAPVRILTKVLLPAPLAPMSAWTSPGLTASDADLRATTEPYVLATLEASSNRSGGVFVWVLVDVGQGEEFRRGGGRQGPPSRRGYFL